MKTRLLFCLLCVSVISSDLASQTYSTSFDLSESPISEGGKWTNGRVAGKDWADVKTANGRATGLQIPSSYCLDNTAILAGNWGPDQTVTATIYNELSQSGGAPEIEIRLRSKISAHVNSGYEILMSAEKNSGAYLTIVRWNGPPCDYAFLEPLRYVQGDGQGSECIVRTGDVVKATIIGSEIKVYYNNVLQLTATDNVFKTGAPGIGFDYVDENLSVLSTFGFSDFSVTATGGVTASMEPLYPVLDQDRARDRHMTILDASGASRLLVMRLDGRAVARSANQSSVGAGAHVLRPPHGGEAVLSIFTGH